MTNLKLIFQYHRMLSFSRFPFLCGSFTSQFPLVSASTAGTRHQSKFLSFSVTPARFYSVKKMSTETETYFNAALELSKEAGELVRERFSEIKVAEVKSCDIDLVTETDKQVEELLIQGLKKQFPDHKFIGEESSPDTNGVKLTDDPTWIIDPIDGTLNFFHAFPHCCISIGLFVNGTPEIGIIYNPILEQLFTAKKGQGAFYNGRQIKTSGHTDLSQAIIMLENGTNRDPERYKALTTNQHTLIPLVHGIRSLGSAALNMAMVALGGADAYFEFGIHIWDMAAGEIIVKEAGGVVVDPTGAPVDRMSRRVLCASSQAMADQITQKLVQYYPLPRD